MLALLGVYLRLKTECLLENQFTRRTCNNSWEWDYFSGGATWLCCDPGREKTGKIIMQHVKASLTSSLWVTGKMVSISSDLGGLPRSWLWLWDDRGGGFPSSLRTWRSPLAVAPALSFRTGLVSHFFSVLTERLDPGELGAELPDACGGSDTTEVEMLPSLPAAEYESGDGSGRGEWGSDTRGFRKLKVLGSNVKSTQATKIEDNSWLSNICWLCLLDAFSWCGRDVRLFFPKMSSKGSCHVASFSDFYFFTFFFDINWGTNAASVWKCDTRPLLIHSINRFYYRWVVDYLNSD